MTASGSYLKSLRQVARIPGVVQYTQEGVFLLVAPAERPPDPRALAEALLAPELPAPLSLSRLIDAREVLEISGRRLAKMSYHLGILEEGLPTLSRAIAEGTRELRRYRGRDLTQELAAKRESLAHHKRLFTLWTTARPLLIGGEGSAPSSGVLDAIRGDVLASWDIGAGSRLEEAARRVHALYGDGAGALVGRLATRADARADLERSLQLLLDKIARYRRGEPLPRQDAALEQELAGIERVATPSRDSNTLTLICRHLQLAPESARGVSLQTPLRSERARSLLVRLLGPAIDATDHLALLLTHPGLELTLPDVGRGAAWWLDAAATRPREDIHLLWPALRESTASSYYLKRSLRADIPAALVLRCLRLGIDAVWELLDGTDDLAAYLDCAERLRGHLDSLRIDDPNFVRLFRGWKSGRLPTILGLVGAWRALDRDELITLGTLLDDEQLQRATTRWSRVVRHEHPALDWLCAYLGAPDELHAYLHHRVLLGQGATFSAALLKPLRTLEAESRQLAWLDAQGTETARLRAAKLRDPEARAGRRERAVRETRNRLTRALASLRSESLDHLLEDVTRSHLAQFLGRPITSAPPPGVLDALHLLKTQVPREALSHFLTEILDGRSPLERAANERWLRHARSNGIDTERWLAGVEARATVDGEPLRIATSRDPVHILRMGSYFNTCLSMGGMNHGATLTNAIDANKQVIFVWLGTRLIGRKLIGLTATGALAGYRTYLTESIGGLTERIHEEILSFATACGATASDTATPENLHGGFWYDDGNEPWHTETTEPWPLNRSYAHERKLDRGTPTHCDTGCWRALQRGEPAPEEPGMQTFLAGVATRSGALRSVRRWRQTPELLASMLTHLPPDPEGVREVLGHVRKQARRMAPASSQPPPWLAWAPFDELLETDGVLGPSMTPNARATWTLAYRARWPDDPRPGLLRRALSRGASDALLAFLAHQEVPHLTQQLRRIFAEARGRQRVELAGRALARHGTPEDAERLLTALERWPSSLMLAASVARCGTAEQTRRARSLWRVEDTLFQRNAHRRPPVLGALRALGSERVTLRLQERHAMRDIAELALPGPPALDSGGRWSHRGIYERTRSALDALPGMLGALERDESPPCDPTLLASYASQGVSSAAVLLMHALSNALLTTTEVNQTLMHAISRPSDRATRQRRFTAFVGNGHLSWQEGLAAVRGLEDVAVPAGTSKVWLEMLDDLCTVDLHHEHPDIALRLAQCAPSVFADLLQHHRGHLSLTSLLAIDRLDDEALRAAWTHAGPRERLALLNQCWYPVPGLRDRLLPLEHGIGLDAVRAETFGWRVFRHLVRRIVPQWPEEDRAALRELLADRDPVFLEALDAT